MSEIGTLMTLVDYYSIRNEAEKTKRMRKNKNLLSMKDVNKL